MKFFNKLFGDDRAVSPVIGVVLMVAVVVILAAVIGAFVLGLGGSQQTTPQASFTFEPATAAGTGGTLTHSGGDEIDPTNLYVIADGAGRTAWGGSNSGPNGGVVAGDSATVTATNTIKVIYDDGSGNSAVLATIEV